MAACSLPPFWLKPFFFSGLPPGSIIFHFGSSEMKYNAPRWQLAACHSATGEHYISFRELQHPTYERRREREQGRGKEGQSQKSMNSYLFGSPAFHAALRVRKWIGKSASAVRKPMLQAVSFTTCVRKEEEERERGRGREGQGQSQKTLNSYLFG